MILLVLGCAEMGDLARKVAPGASAAPVLPSCATEGEAPAARGCLSGALACGSRLSGTTLGGDSAWDDDFYATAFCFPAGQHHSGAERVYTLTAPKDTQVTVRMTSTCVDLDLAAVAWDYDGRCPTVKHPITECEGDVRPGPGGSVMMQAFHERQYLIVVDGKEGAVGPFELSGECAPRRPIEDRGKAPVK